MKKLRYYAPYWVSLLIVISAVIAIPAYKRSKEITLYNYAFTLEDNSYFVNRGYILREVKTYDNGYVLIESTEDTLPRHVTLPESTDLNELLPGEFTGYIRQDGSAWRVSDVSTRSSTILEPYLPLDTDITLQKRNILLSIEEAGYASFNVVLLNKESASIRSPQCYLYAKLADGNYYRIFEDYDYCLPIDPMECAVFRVKLPYSYEQYYTGSYRVLIYEDTYSQKHADDHIPPKAIPIATVDFELIRVPKEHSKFYDYKLTSFRSSEKDFIAG